MDWTAAKTDNQLEMEFAMLKTIMNFVTLMREIVVIIIKLVIVLVMMLTIIHGVVPMIGVIAVWMTQLLPTALIANAMKMTHPSAK